MRGMRQHQRLLLGWWLPTDNAYVGLRIRRKLLSNLDKKRGERFERDSARSSPSRRKKGTDCLSIILDNLSFQNPI